MPLQPWASRWKRKRRRDAGSTAPGSVAGVSVLWLGLCLFAGFLSRKHNAGWAPAAADGARGVGEGGRKEGKEQSAAPQDKEAPQVSPAVLAGLGGQVRRRKKGEFADRYREAGWHCHMGTG